MVVLMRMDRNAGDHEINARIVLDLLGRIVSVIFLFCGPFSKTDKLPSSKVPGMSTCLISIVLSIITMSILNFFHL
jgi:hypothetical protein